MPAKSKAQQRLMAAAAHGATFPLARKLRASMSQSSLHDFAATPRAGLPPHTKGATMQMPSRPCLGNCLHGDGATEAGQLASGMLERQGGVGTAIGSTTPKGIK